MKYLVYFIFLLIVFGCSNTDRIEDKFNVIESYNYSDFKNVSITKRKGSYMVTYEGLTYLIDINIFTGKITNIDRYSSNSQGLKVKLLKNERANLEDLLCSFDKLEVLSLSVDENSNVYISIPWVDRCTYYFVRLSSSNTLDDINRNNYLRYKDNWYTEKECAK